MTVGIKQISEYNRQYQWHDIPPRDPVAGLPSYKEYKSAEPPLQSNQRPTLELSSKEELPEVIKTFGSPSKDLHMDREPSFSKKKRVPGSSPERIKVNKSLAKKAGLSKHVNTARYQSVYAAEFSPKKGKLPKASSPIQSAKINFVDSKTNLPIGQEPVDKKETSEYSSQFSDPTEAMRHIRDLYREQMRRKQLELDKLEKAVETKPPTPKPSSPLPAPELVTEPAVIEKEPEKPKPIYCSPLRADKPKVRSYDLIAPSKCAKLNWQSEYKTRFGIPVKPEVPISSAYGKRSHPYKQVKTPDHVEDLMNPDKSDIVVAPAPQPSVNWYQEVMELRKLAQQFKARSHGSHFSPQKMATLAFSNAQLRDTQTIPSNAESEESVRIIPKDKTSPKEKKVPKLETDVTVTDLEEECPNIENLIIKTKSLTESPKKLPSPPSKSPKKSEKSPPATTAGKAVVEKAVSETSTPRTADRTCTLFEGRVSTPKLKNIGSRHHLDRTTHKWQNERISSNIDMKTALLPGRAATPILTESRHHLDPTTPVATKGLGTQPFSPKMSDQVQEKLDFTTPVKSAATNGWTKDLDRSVLSRASSCTSLASATLDKAKQRDKEFWKK